MKVVKGNFTVKTIDGDEEYGTLELSLTEEEYNNLLALLQSVNNTAGEAVGLGLVGMLSSINVPLKVPAEKVKLTYRDGSEVSFSDVIDAYDNPLTEVKLMGRMHEGEPYVYTSFSFMESTDPNNKDKLQLFWNIS